MSQLNLLPMHPPRLHDDELLQAPVYGQSSPPTTYGVQTQVQGLGLGYHNLGTETSVLDAPISQQNIGSFFIPSPSVSPSNANLLSRPSAVSLSAQNRGFAGIRGNESCQEKLARTTSVGFSNSYRRPPLSNLPARIQSSTPLCSASFPALRPELRYLPTNGYRLTPVQPLSIQASPPAAPYNSYNLPSQTKQSFFREDVCAQQQYQIQEQHRQQLVTLGCYEPARLGNLSGSTLLAESPFDESNGNLYGFASGLRQEPLDVGTPAVGRYDTDNSVSLPNQQHSAAHNFHRGDSGRSQITDTAAPHDDSLRRTHRKNNETYIKQPHGKGYLCCICTGAAVGKKKVYGTEAKIKRHVKGCHSGAYPCADPQCSKVFTRLDNMKAHWRKHHGIGD